MMLILRTSKSPEREGAARMHVNYPINSMTAYIPNKKYFCAHGSGAGETPAWRGKHL